MGHLRRPLRFGVALALVADRGLEQLAGNDAHGLLAISVGEDGPTALVLVLQEPNDKLVVRHRFPEIGENLQGTPPYAFPMAANFPRSVFVNRASFPATGDRAPCIVSSPTAY